MRNFRVLLIGNYLPDEQQSMIRMGTMLKNIYSLEFEVCQTTPPSIFGSLPLIPWILRKYLSYIDKLIVFPIIISFTSWFYDLVHIVDHGNAYYSFFVFHNRCIVSCHDLLAIRGAVGDSSVACKPSLIGGYLQLLIKSGLKHAKAIAFVSNSTFSDYRRLIGINHLQTYQVIPNPLNHNLYSSADDIRISKKDIEKLPTTPFLLMVGNSHPRKNRILGIQLISLLSKNYSYSLVLAGKPLSPLETKLMHNLQIQNHIYFIQSPSDEFLNYLYCTAHALIFPSIAEGFGWPLIEAQACSCPVIASDSTSLPEVAGSGALYSKYDDVNKFAEHVISLNNNKLRQHLILEGNKNLNRYNYNNIQLAYLKFASNIIKRGI